MRCPRLALGVAALFGSALVVSTVAACLWDYDTLQMERKRFPGLHELIVGKFTRHSPAYYEWRIKDRIGKLEQTPGVPALIDDLAVAYDKLGRQAEGIQLLEECLAQHPDRYETVANLGTLYAHSGDLKRGAELIRKAIEINPDAHFGREKYQLLLIEYVQNSERDSTGVLLTASREGHEAVGFAKFVLNGVEIEQAAQQQELDKAVKGVLGILHFGDFRSPIVLEALGDLLLRGIQHENYAHYLAARCYAVAAIRSEDPKAKTHLRKFAEQALELKRDRQYPRNELNNKRLQRVMQELEQELDEANKWFETIARDERQWIDEGRDVDAEFTRKYYESLERSLGDTNTRLAAEREPLLSRLGAARQSRAFWPIVLGILTILGLAGRRVLRRRQTTPSA